MKTPSLPMAVICLDLGRNMVRKVRMQVTSSPNPKSERGQNELRCAGVRAAIVTDIEDVGRRTLRVSEGTDRLQR